MYIRKKHSISNILKEIKCSQIILEMFLRGHSVQGILIIQIQIHKLKGVSNMVKINYFLFLKMVEKLIVAKWSQGSIINISYKKWRTFFRQRKNTNLSNYWHLRRYILWTILLDIHLYYLFDNISIWLQWPCCQFWSVIGCSHIISWMVRLQYCYTYWFNFLWGMISTWKIMSLFTTKNTFSVN